MLKVSNKAKPCHAVSKMFLNKAKLCRVKGVQPLETSHAMLKVLNKAKPHRAKGGE
jgi:hypothetical protein